MIPDVPTVLNGIVRATAMELAPEITSSYGTLNVQLMSALLMMIGQEFDRATARLVDENHALRDLFRAGVDVVADEELRQRLREATEAPTTTLRVSDLQERNRELRGLFVQLHAHVETLTSPAARALDERLWKELALSTQRRALDLAIG
jgi:hypothetical protein